MYNNNSNKIHIIVVDLDNANKINNVLDSDKYKEACEAAVKKIKETMNKERFKPKYSKDLKDKIDTIKAAYLDYIDNDDCDFDDDEEGITNQDIMDTLSWLMHEFQNLSDSMNKSLADIHAAITKFDKTSNSTKKDLEAIIADRNREINEKAKIIKDLKARLKEYENTNAINNESEEYKEEDMEFEVPDYLSVFLNSMNDVLDKYFHSKYEEE